MSNDSYYVPPIYGPNSTRMVFSTYDVKLPDGTSTLPTGQCQYIQPIANAAIRALTFALGSLNDKRIGDLGCSEGGHTLNFAQHGANAVGIDGRAINMERCNYIKSYFPQLKLQFIEDDVKNLEMHGEFDAIFCCGLLYHIDNPVELLKKVCAASKVLLLGTHYAMENSNPYNCGPITEHEGYKGRWFNDPRGISTWSSFSNDTSFWLEKRHLVKALMDVGYKMVFEQYDFLGDPVANNYIQEYDRSLFLAIRD